MYNFFKKVCSQLHLGNLLEPPMPIIGGITNKLYKLITDNGNYAVKVINSDNINKNPKLLENIELSEGIAFIARKNNINAVNALKFNNKFIQKIDDNYLLIYNWCDGKILLTKEITVDNVSVIAHLLAKLHCIKVEYDIETVKYKKIDYRKYYNLLINNDEEWAKVFCDNYDKLNEIYEKVFDCYQKLSNKVSYVHKDLNRKNIMWEDNVPYIIDWETATIGDPSLDFFNSAWFLTADIDEDKFYTFAGTYFSINKLEDDKNIAVYASIIDECNWLEFSLKRALSIHSTDDNEIKIGKSSVIPSLTEILKYYDKIPLMLKILNKLNI